MVPRLLRVRNFLSYGDEPVEVDFAGLHLACLSGGNGNGKSALLDAITWVLWGRSRAKREDDLVRLGATEMDVELEFVSGGAYYRALRKRTLRKSGSTAALELHAQGPDGQYTSITGGTMAETQARLSDLLKLGYETFINSTFLLQGRADEFTVKPPAQRKAVLSEILGLEVYERLAERARERARALAARSASLRDDIAGREVEVARRPALHDELGALERERVHVTETRHHTEAELWAARAERQSMEERERELQRLERHAASLDREVATIQGRIDEAHATVAQAERLLRDEARIVRDAEEARRLRGELDELSRQQTQANGLAATVTAIRHEIEVAMVELRHELKAAQQRADGLAAAGARVEHDRRRLGELVAGEDRIAAVEGERARLAGELHERQAEMAQLEADNKVLDSEMAPLRQKLKLLQELGAECPVCKKPMDDAERMQVYRQVKDDGLQKRGRRDENDRRLVALRADIEHLVNADGSLARELARLQRAAGEIAGLRQRLAEAEKAAAECETLAARAEDLHRRLAVGDVAHEARARLVVAEEALRALGYDATAHESAQSRARHLEGVETMLAELATARERHKNAAATIGALGDDLCDRRRQLADVQGSLRDVRASLAQLPEIEARLATAQAAVATRRAEEESLNRRIGTLDERLRALDDLEVRLRADRVQLQALEREGDAHAELGRIFGKAGIQAMIIDNALPELERGANAILSRMGDTGMRIQFDTQAQGSKRDLLETLDIQISDASGTRPYEMYSGGEAFRVNFAIRIALSRLLADRAGARLHMLVIDEGFGTQDGQGRERLVQAINSIADDFETILVVTHLDELKDLFGARIEVVKGSEGSRVLVTAA